MKLRAKGLASQPDKLTTATHHHQTASTVANGPARCKEHYNPVLSSTSIEFYVGCYSRADAEAHAQRHSAHLFVKTADIETTSPEPRTYTQKADSGNEMTRAWCDGCGAGVWLRSASKPGLTFLKAGEFRGG